MCYSKEDFTGLFAQIEMQTNGLMTKQFPSVQQVATYLSLIGMIIESAGEQEG